MAKPQPIHRVAIVEGRMVPHPSSIGTGSMTMVGHEKYTSEDPADIRFPFGVPEPGQKFKPRQPGDGETIVHELIQETGDGFVERKIRDGDLDYIETVEAFDAELGTGIKIPQLVKYTEANKAARAPKPKVVETKPEEPKTELAPTVVRTTVEPPSQVELAPEITESAPQGAQDAPKSRRATKG